MRLVYAPTPGGEPWLKSLAVRRVALTYAAGGGRSKIIVTVLVPLRGSLEVSASSTFKATAVKMQ